MNEDDEDKDDDEGFFGIRGGLRAEAEVELGAGKVKARLKRENTNLILNR